MNKICIVIPPSPFLLDERVFMSLGPLKVAAILEENDIAVDVLDLSGVKNYEAAVEDYVASSPTRMFGLTATTPQLPAAMRIAAVLKTHGADRIILGGPHATLVRAACKNERGRRAWKQLTETFDVLVAGDGEKAIMAAIADDAPPVIDADDRKSPYWMNDSYLEASPYPARHLVDVASYKYTIDGVPALSLISQLGCPFGCGFCAGRHSPMLRHIRSRSAWNIISEMTEMRDRYDTKGFMFYDDELNVNPRLMELLKFIEGEQIARKEEWRLRGFIKAELFTDEQAAAMYRAGFRWILVGFESGADRILDNINKKATKADNTRCMEIARRAGLKVKALMSLGHPGESNETVNETYDWLLSVKPDDFDVTIITPYPGSPYYDDATAVGVQTYVYQCGNGDRLFMDAVDYAAEADYYKGAPNGGYVAHVWTDALGPTDLVMLRDGLERRVRAKLGIPYNAAAPALLYEHSMGQSALPPHLLRSSHDMTVDRGPSWPTP